ncbi:hypothetical protein G4B88_023717 [Cannabis sativa]|uniref:Cyclic nucleotide-binding domain-containing protein n=1 Tax=Cannabis sativa TaxID=3483 RepID=A0A7J6HV75_CANSA|nr:hypothetical protein G4B88_023717 [Cannabis sativa]
MGLENGRDDNEFHHHDMKFWWRKIKEILNEKRCFVPMWNKTFLLVCVIAVTLDPLFLYIPMIDKDRKCIKIDNKLRNSALVLRSLTDIIYIIDIICNVAKAIELLKKYHIVKITVSAVANYTSWSLVFVDFLAILPLPQVIIILGFDEGLSVIILGFDKGIIEASGSSSKILLNAILLSQYLPRVFRIYQSCKELEKSQDTVTRIVWVKGGLNFFLYILASHVFGSFWYFYSFQRETSCWERACNLYGKESCENSSTLFGGDLEISVHLDKTWKQLATAKSEELGEKMKLKEQEIEVWIEKNGLPKEEKTSIMLKVKHKLKENKQVDAENLLSILPSQDAKRLKLLLCLPLLKKVPLFENMEREILELICEHLKVVIYTESSYIIREGDPLDRMIFITHGTAWAYTNNNSDSVSTRRLKKCDYFGEELLEWSRTHTNITDFPIGTTNVKSHTKVEAFSLMANDLLNIVKNNYRFFRRNIPTNQQRCEISVQLENDDHDHVQSHQTSKSSWDCSRPLPSLQLGTMFLSTAPRLKLTLTSGVVLIPESQKLTMPEEQALAFIGG